jgi:8-oxo-dGTP pyrophosphatase MutT (NUDIX family)
MKPGCMLVTHDYNLGVIKNNILEKPQQFFRALKEALIVPLPGSKAQHLMSPPQRISHPHRGIKPRNSAILILMYPTSHGIHIPFTLRLHTLAHHAGEISFPGGGVEEKDPTLIHTALRETAEELGIDEHAVIVLGQLTPLYVSASQNMIQPIVGWLDERPTFSPSPYEVERIIEVPVTTLLDPGIVGEYQRVKHGQILTAPCYRIDSECIWGATAMILSEFILIVNTRILSQTL